MDSNYFPSISIITLTKNRKNKLLRSIRSVVNQDYGGKIEHIIIGDNCNDLEVSFNQIQDINPDIIIQNKNLETHYDYIPERLSVLLNIGLDIANGQYLSFLDDDNEFQKNHISSLVKLIHARKFDAVHSHRFLFKEAGQPYLTPLLPWSRSIEEAQNIYRIFVNEGILSPGSHIMRDTMFKDKLPKFRVRGTVDTSEWLIPSEILKHYKIPMNYSPDDKKYRVSQDNKIVNLFASENLRIGCSYLPTLNYYLGGFSNRKLVHL